MQARHYILDGRTSRAILDADLAAAPYAAIIEADKDTLARAALLQCAAADKRIFIEFDPNATGIQSMIMPSAGSHLPDGAPAFDIAATVAAAVKIALEKKRPIAPRIPGTGTKILALLGYDCPLADAQTVRRAVSAAGASGFDATIFVDVSGRVAVVAGDVPCLA